MTSQNQTVSPSSGDTARDPDLLPHSGFPGYSLIPLAEFGQSLDNPSLDAWFVDFADRNKFCYDFYEITARGELKIMPAAGLPHALHQPQLAANVRLWAERHGAKLVGSKAASRCRTVPDRATT